MAGVLEQEQRNPGVPLDLGWVNEVRVNRSAVERRTATLSGRRTVKQAWQVAWLLRAISCIDLTTLAGDDTDGTVRRLCAKARQPARADLLESLGAAQLGLTVGAVCVYHAFVPVAVEALAGSRIPVAAGAHEIDIVISRRHILTADWQALYEEVQAFRRACGTAHMKTILATGDLGTLRNVGKASLVCMMAGADFISGGNWCAWDSMPRRLSATRVRSVGRARNRSR